MEFLPPPKDTCTPLFYGLPKMHKPDCPLCPIVSGCDGPTDHLSAYITHFIQPLDSNLPSHIKDTKHFLNLTEKLPPLPSNALLVTADVTSLYTNIPHEEGVAAVIHFMEKYKHLLPTNCPPPHIAPSNLWTRIYTKFVALLWELGWLPLCQAIHGQGGMHHNPNIPPPNLLLETFH